MLIDSNHALVQPLVEEWNKARSFPEEARVKLAEELQIRLATTILSLVQPLAGELILLQHEFLTMESTGEHSFAYGSSMRSKTVYWVHAARLTVPASLVAKVSPPREIVDERRKLRIITPPSFLISTMWQWVLYPYYPSDRNQPAFGFTLHGKWLPWATRPEPDEVSKPTTDPLDITCLGDHLFRTREGRHDWATKVSLVVGTEAVREWLSESASSETFTKLLEQETC